MFTVSPVMRNRRVCCSSLAPRALITATRLYCCSDETTTGPLLTGVTGFVVRKLFFTSPKTASVELPSPHCQENIESQTVRSENTARFMTLTNSIWFYDCFEDSGSLERNEPPHRSQVAVRFLLRTPLVGPRYEGPVAPLEHVFDVLKSEDTNCRLWTSGPEINQIATVTSTSLRQIWDVLTWTGIFRNRANMLKLWVCFIWVNNDWPKTRTYTRSCWICWFCCFRCHGYQISHTLKENVPKDAVQERISCQPSDDPVKTPLIFHCLF